MPFELSLIDLVSPYVLQGDTFGAWHAVLSIFRVAEHEIGSDENGITIRGTVDFEGNLSLDPTNMSMTAANAENHPQNDPSRRDPWIDIRDAKLDFQLVVPRVASQKVSTAVAAIGNAGNFANAAAVITAYDTNPNDAPPSDYPTTGFTLDLLLTTVVLRPPFLRGAKREPNGQLVPDPQHEQVKFTLPRLKFRLQQGPLNGDPITAVLLSAGATGLDDPGDIAVAELIKMEPPYAFIGSSQVVGFGFRSGILDLSNGSTPPDVLSQFGFDESWTGLYLPEIRLFIAPHGAQDFAIDAGVENLLIGVGASSGVTGDFSLQVLDQGAGPLKLGARFYDADQRGYGLVRTSDTTGTVQLPERSRMVADVEGGRTPITTTITVQGSPAVHDRVADIDMSTAAERTITISVTDSSSPQRNGTLTITATRRPPAQTIPGTTTLGPVPAAVLTTTSMTQGGATVQQPRLIAVAETASTVTVALDTTPARQALTQWTINGTPRGTSSTVTVDLPPGADATIHAELPGENAVGEFTGYYRFDQPPYKVGDRIQTREDTKNFARQTDNTHTTTASDEGTTSNWLGGSEVRSALLPLLQGLPNNTPVTINCVGYASYEGPAPPDTDNTKRAYNQELAGRRAIGLRAIIEDLLAAPSSNLGSKNVTVTDAPQDMTPWPTQGYPEVSTRRVWWKAIASWNAASNTGGIVVEGTLHRDPQSSSTTDPVIVDPPPPPNSQPAPPPRWFRQMGGKVRIVRNQFVACEVTAKIDIQTAAEDRLQGSMPPGDSGTLPAGQPIGANPADGLIDFRLVIQIDDATDTVSIIGYYGADPADVDGLWLFGTRPGQTPAGEPGFGLNFFGTTIVFMPLIDAAVGAVANDGALAELGMTAGMLAIPAVIAGLAEVNNSPVKVRCERVIWYGGEVQFRSRPSGVECVILFDMEAALSVDVSISNKTLLKIDRSAPLAVRYKAVGVRIGDNPALGRFQFKPVFDASKGYTIDVSRPGAITVASPLDQILTVLGARVARNNPLVFEVDLGFAVDLGVVSIERARVRLKFDPLGPPELTAFAAGIDIPGAIKGRGYMEMNENEIKGQIDVTIVPVQVRIAAGLGVANIDENGRKATGVIVTLEVEFPVAIPLGPSGLGIYGFLGLFAMHYHRKEPPPSNMAPALAWLKNIAQGNPVNIAAWEPKIDNWAFGVGAVLGIMGSSVVFNMKGVILLELPGPRLLLMMKANVLAVMPQLKGTAEGTFLAIIDLDMGRGTLTIGISVDFSIQPLLQIYIPVEAFFNFNDRKDWHLYLGRYVDQIHAKILEVFEGSGYLMLSGKGFVAGDLHSDLPVPVKGFAISTGLHVSFVWGSKSIRLYAEVAAGFDAVLGFDPFRLTGILYVRGTLHVFIIDLSAWANLTVDIGEKPDGSKVSRISGEICGRIEFLFFTIEGCVDFAIGSSSVPAVTPPELFQSLKLVSRSPALAVGTGVDKPIDGGIAEGVKADAQPPAPPDPPPPAPVGQPQPEVPLTDRRVPIDAIPLVMMAMPPVTASTEYHFRGASVNLAPGPGTPEAPADGWVQKGNDVFQYTLKKVELIGELLDGSTPAVWWPQKAGDEAMEAQLALLSWVPDPTPKAIEKSKFLEETIKETWGTVCEPAAPPTSVLWTFLQEPFGPSLYGWMLDGEPWPDPPNTVRSQPPPTKLKVTERWRTSVYTIDTLTGIIPAEIVGAPVICPPKRPEPGTPGTTVPGTSTTSPGTTVPPVAPPLTTIPGTFIPITITNPLLPVTTTVRPTFRAGLANPIAAAKGRKRPDLLPLANVTVSDMVRMANNGEPITRAMMTSLNVTAAAAATNPDSRCTSRVLAAPMMDSRPLQPFGGEQRLEQIEAGWKRRKFKPGPFDDAVVFHTGQVETATFYLFVWREILASRIVVVSATDGNDQVFQQVTVDTSMAMPPATFPGRWVDPNGPWFDETVHVAQHQASMQQAGYLGVIVTIKGHEKADRIQIGLKPQPPEWHRKVTRRPFFVAAIEALHSAEFWRHDYDTKEQKKKQGVLEGALSAGSSGNALLRPDTAYAVKVTYDASRGKRPPGQGVSDKSDFPDVQQTFWFYTEREAPRRLDPWMMCSAPEDGEHHYFGEIPLRIVFNSEDVGRIYDAYGKELRVKLRASSFRPLPSTPQAPHPLPLTPDHLLPVKGSLLSPWEEVVEDLLTNSCVPISGERTRHSMVVMPIPLEPFTDYILDIEMVDKGAAANATGPSVWRIGFSTGRFATVDRFALSFQLDRVLHRYSKPGELQAIGTAPWAGNPQGNQLDQAMIDAGLEPMGVPSAPRIVVFWETNGPTPQPAAVLVDASEPMWRSRKIPRKVVDATPPNAERYELTQVEWLKLEQQAGGDAIVDKIVKAPGGQRALISLKPNSRGKKLKLGLRQVAMKEPYLDGPAATDQLFTIVETILNRAPWEEEED
ncbi:MAG: hypothetical protein IT168_21625 [Bryobacterales bacterium]|nr:hypothetical protein [Bryobacterales bacterium]